MLHKDDVIAPKVIHTEPLNVEWLLEVEVLKAWWNSDFDFE